MPQFRFAYNSPKQDWKTNHFLSRLPLPLFIQHMFRNPLRYFFFFFFFFLVVHEDALFINNDNHCLHEITNIWTPSVIQPGHGSRVFKEEGFYTYTDHSNAASTCADAVGQCWKLIFRNALYFSASAKTWRAWSTEHCKMCNGATGIRTDNSLFSISIGIYQPAGTDFESSRESQINFAHVEKGLGRGGVGELRESFSGLEISGR